MGSFLSFLGGLSKGSGDAFGEIDKQQREEKARQNAWVAEALHKEMTTNENLTPEQQDHLLTQVLTLKGIKDKKLLEGIKHAAGYHRRSIADMEKQSKQAPELQAPQQTTPEGVQLPPTAALPSLPTPPYQAKSVGQLNFEEGRGRTRQAEDDKAEAAREAARRAAKGSLEDKINIFHEYEGTSMEDEVRYMLGMAPRSTAGAGVESRNLPGNGMRGKDVIELFKRHNKPTDGIDEAKLYNVTIGRDGRTPIGAFPKEESAIGTGKEVSGAQLKAMGIKKDRGGADVVDGGTYTILHSGQGGGILGAIPTNQLQTYAEQHNIKVTTDGDGNVIAVPVTESTTTTKTPTGVTPGAATLPPMPQAPGGLATTDTALGAGGTPRPNVPSVQGRTPIGGPPGARVIGQKPIEIPETKVDAINSSQDLLIHGKALQEMIPRIKNSLGPLTGRLSGMSMDYLGGLGLSKDVVTFLTNAREYMASEALKRGGKTLPMGEKQIYTNHLPNGNDTPQSLVTKLEVLLPLVEKDYNNQLKGLTGNQRKKLMGTENVEVGGPMPNRPTPGAPSGKILVIRKSDGVKGSVDAKDFDPSKYEKR